MEERELIMNEEVIVAIPEMISKGKAFNWKLLGGATFVIAAATTAGVLYLKRRKAKNQNEEIIEEEYEDEK